MNPTLKNIPVSSESILSVILGGGQGTRLFPLTKLRSKPAVPLGGKYRLVDIPISNCINSGLQRIYLLHAEIRDSLLGISSQVSGGSSLRRTVMMGADYHEMKDAVRANATEGVPPIGIGRNSRIENAIIDKNALIGDNCVITPTANQANWITSCITFATAL